MRLLTLNLRQDLDRWPERLPLVVAALAEADADVIALQEVALPIEQDELLAEALGGTPSTGRRSGATPTRRRCPC